MRVLSVCNNPILTEILEKVASSSGAKLSNFVAIEDALSNIDSLKPEVVVINEDFSEELILRFLRGVRERYSLIVPTYVILNFHTSLDIRQIKNLGAETIIKPVSENSLREKLFPPLKSQESSSIKESSSLKIDEIIEKLKPYIREEIKKETTSMIKKLLEVLEKRDESDSYISSRNL